MIEFLFYVFCSHYQHLLPDAEAVRQLDELIRNAQLATTTLASAVALSPVQTVAASSSQVASVLDNLSEAIRKGDAKAIKTGVGNAVDALGRHIDLATTWANSIEDPEEKKEALAQIKRLKELKDQISTTGKALAANPTDPKLQSQLEGLVSEAKSIVTSMVTPSQVRSFGVYFRNVDLLVGGSSFKQSNCKQS